MPLTVTGCYNELGSRERKGKQGIYENEAHIETPSPILVYIHAKSQYKYERQSINCEIMMHISLFGPNCIKNK